MSYPKIQETSLNFHPKILLNFQEATAKLHTLTPGSEEYSRLQQILIQASGIFKLWTFHNIYIIDLTTKNGKLLGGFGSSEHVAIGEDVVLHGFLQNTPLLMKGPIQVHFGHIVALAGDFYALYGRAISLPGGTTEDKTRRFRGAFSTLERAENHQVRNIIAEIQSEYDVVKHSGHPHHCYSHDMMERNQTIKRIKPDIDDLLIDNSDHFSENAIEAYQIGHAEAIRTARVAGETKDLEGLKLAYAYDAFACHFLSDLFASGHIRNQRGALEIFLIERLGTSPENAKKLSGLLTGAQHEKDGDEGLYIENRKGECWRAYGDGWLFHPKNQKNREKVTQASQASVDEVYQTYKNPAIENPSQMDLYIPKATSFNQPSLYQIENKSLFLLNGTQRTEITTLYDYLFKAIPLALKHLPESYINGFIDGAINIQPPEFIQNGKILIDKVIVPRSERLTGAIWHVIGIATYYQVKQQSQALNQKMTEVAEGVMAIHDNTIQILKKLDEVEKLIKCFAARQSLREHIGPEIKNIKNGVFEFEREKGKLDDERLPLIKNRLRDAYMNLSRSFIQDGKTIFQEYKSILFKNSLSSLTEEQEEDLTPEEKIKLTLWFRQMLDYQILAFGLYLTLCRSQDENERTVQEKISNFEQSIDQQIGANQANINMDLINESSEFIALELEKNKVSMQAALLFKEA